MQHRHAGPTAGVVLCVVVLFAAVSLSAHRAEAAPPGDEAPGRTIRGAVKSLDPATGDLLIAWKHPNARETMPFQARIAADAKVTLNGEPATAADLRPADRVETVGKPAKVDGKSVFLVSRVAAERDAATSAPAPAASADGVKAADPKVDAILDRLERKGEKIESIQTDITFTKLDPVLEDKQVFKGILRFKQDKPNPRFFIRFDKFIQEGIERDKKEWHVFDGEYYIEARESTHTIVKRQIVRPGEQVNLFRVGQGPFPLPFGQKKAEILEHFDCKLVPPRKSDPAETDHLECTPKPGTEMARKFGKIDFWIHHQRDLPVRVQTTEKNENIEVKAEFPVESIEVNKPLDGSGMRLPDLGSDFTTSVVPLEAKAGQ